MTKKVQDTRERIIEIGAAIIHSQGYNHTGIQEILDASGVPKGSFYFYFKNKEDFGLQVVKHYNEKFAEVAANILGDTRRKPLARLRKFLQFFVHFFESKGCALGCPVANLAQEMSDLSPVFRQMLDKSLGIMTTCYADILAEARDAGDIPADMDPEETARFLVSSWQGAVIRMKVEKDIRALTTFETMVFDRLLAKA